MIAKLLVFGTEAAQIESSSLIGNPVRTKKPHPSLQQSWRHLSTAKQPSHQINDAIKPSHTNDATYTSRHARVTNPTK
ncbi:hypothetical protein TNCV_934471 [Trichonephila clavipes]|nr:hypothetical protein TNCV_934471 [Trichonephila clavipes]